MTVAEYIATKPYAVQVRLLELRALLHEVAPNIKESLKWGHPVFEGKSILFSYSAFKNHINFFPTRPALEPFLADLKDFKCNKDSVQLPYNKPLPSELIKKIAIYRVKQVQEKDAKWRY